MSDDESSEEADNSGRSAHETPSSSAAPSPRSPRPAAESPSPEAPVLKASTNTTPAGSKRGSRESNLSMGLAGGRSGAIAAQAPEAKGAPGGRAAVISFDETSDDASVRSSHQSPRETEELEAENVRLRAEVESLRAELRASTQLQERLRASERTARQELEDERRKYVERVEVLEAAVQRAEDEQRRQADAQQEAVARMQEQLGIRDARWRAEVERLWAEITGQPVPRTSCVA